MLKLGHIVAAAGLALTFFAGGTCAELKEGSDYARISPAQPTVAQNKIEVIEFFWYGCPHCHAFEPYVSKWKQSLPKDVTFRRVPADLGRWASGARLFYALVAIGEEDRLHGELFDAIHVEHLDFNSQTALADWLAREGVDRRKFVEAYNSPGVQADMLNAQRISKDHGIRGVPSMTVGGKYLTSNGMAGGFEELLMVVDQLIARLRAEQSPRKDSP